MENLCFSNQRTCPIGIERRFPIDALNDINPETNDPSKEKD